MKKILLIFQTQKLTTKKNLGFDIVFASASGQLTSI